MNEVLRTLQIKRGLKEKLIAYMVGEHRPAQGEPIYETDTGKLKFGDGINNYADLPYFAADNADFEIEDPLSGDILVYDATDKVFKNKRFVDNKSVKFSDSGLSIAGYADAPIGFMPTKSVSGIAWGEPVSTSTLQTYVRAAETAKTNAENARDASLGYAADSKMQADRAELTSQYIQSWVQNKFWFGTKEEYDQLSSITEGTIYFVRV